MMQSTNYGIEQLEITFEIPGYCQRPRMGDAT